MEESNAAAVIDRPEPAEERRKRNVRAERDGFDLADEREKTVFAGKSQRGGAAKAHGSDYNFFVVSEKREFRLRDFYAV